MGSLQHMGCKGSSQHMDYKGSLQHMDYMRSFSLRHMGCMDCRHFSWLHKGYKLQQLQFARLFVLPERMELQQLLRRIELLDRKQ